MLRQNVVDDIQHPLKAGVRQTKVVTPYHIVRNATQYVLETKQQTNKYEMVYNKRVIDPVTFKTYPYGYNRLNQDDVEIMELLIDLQKRPAMPLATLQRPKTPLATLQIPTMTRNKCK